MKQLLYAILSLSLLSCIGSAVPSPSDGESDSSHTIKPSGIDSIAITDSSLLNMSQMQADSLLFRLTHHYSLNYNFVVKSDSLTLTPKENDLLRDTCRIYKGDVIAVAEIKLEKGDSIDTIWVKVARDQFTMGWVSEQELLRCTTPDDTISQLIDFLSGSRIIWMSMLSLIGIAGIIINRRRQKAGNILGNPISFLNDMDSPYPAIFLTLTGLLACLYASIQNFVPEFWQEYYFHPTLNPLVLPPVMAILVILVWTLIIIYIAVIDEVYHNFYFIPGITFLLKLTGLSMIAYLVISWTTLIHIGYILLAVMIICIWRKQTKEDE